MGNKWQQMDRSLLLIIFFFLGIGLVQVYSSSFIFAMEKYGDGLYIFKRQLLFTAMGIVALLVGFKVSLRWWQKWVSLFWILAALFLLLTFVPGVGIKVGGAQRWVKFPWGYRFEPAELIKMMLPFVMANYLMPLKKPLSGSQWLIRFFIVGLPLFILLQQPDFGSFAIGLIVIFLMLFAFGLKWRYILAGLSLSLPSFYFLIWKVPYRQARIHAFLDPWSDPGQKGFQIIQSMLAFSSGGVWGEGLGQGQGKLFFLPEAHTDFTLAVLGEETGYIGFLIILLLYGTLVFKGLQIASNARETFLRASALGLTVVFGLSVFINMGVVVGLLPTKGLTLPFLSYGGSSLVMTCLTFGWLLNIEQATRTRVTQ